MKQMKTFTFITAILLLLILFPLASNAQVPGQMNYQGYLTDADGNPLDGAYDMRFYIYNDPNDENKPWDEEQSGVPITDGVFNVSLGTVVPIPEGIFTSSYLGFGVAIYNSTSAEWEIF